MPNKFLEKSIEIGSQEIQETSSNKLELEYYLVESETSYDEASAYTKGYGVEIVKKENGDVKESSMVESIYCKRESMELLIGRLAKNSVTPVSLSYILDDLIGI